MVFIRNRFGIQCSKTLFHLVGVLVCLALNCFPPLTELKLTFRQWYFCKTLPYIKRINGFLPCNINWVKCTALVSPQPTVTMLDAYIPPEVIAYQKRAPEILRLLFLHLAIDLLSCRVIAVPLHGFPASRSTSCPDPGPAWDLAYFLRFFNRASLPLVYLNVIRAIVLNEMKILHQNVYFC